MRDIIKTLALAVAMGMAPNVFAQAAEQWAKPTIVLVQDAFAESSSWNGVISASANDGYTAIAAANPLRSVASDEGGSHALPVSHPEEIASLAQKAALAN